MWVLYRLLVWIWRDIWFWPPPSPVPHKAPKGLIWAYACLIQFWTTKVSLWFSCSLLFAWAGGGGRVWGHVLRLCFVRELGLGGAALARVGPPLGSAPGSQAAVLAGDREHAARSLAEIVRLTRPRAQGRVGMSLDPEEQLVSSFGWIHAYQHLMGERLCPPAVPFDQLFWGRVQKKRVRTLILASLLEDLVDLLSWQILVHLFFLQSPASAVLSCRMTGDPGGGGWDVLREYEWRDAHTPSNY